MKANFKEIPVAFLGHLYNISSSPIIFKGNNNMNQKPMHALHTIFAIGESMPSHIFKFTGIIIDAWP